MAKQGILDLSNWDFEKDGNVRLDGDWDFYWHEFLSSKDFDTVHQKHFIKVPKPWNEYMWGKEELGYEGYATYRLRIIVNDKTKDFGLKFPDQGTAFELFLNDSLVGKNGIIGKSRETSEPQWKPLLLAFEKKGDTITLVCQVSNFDYHFGGIFYSPILGMKVNINKVVEDKIRLDYFISGTLIVIAIILLTFFVFRPKEKASLLFSFISIIVFTRLLTTGERIIHFIWNNIPFEFHAKLEGLTWAAVGCTPLFFKLLFPDEYKNIFIMQGIIVGGIIVLIHIILPSYINSQVIPFAQIWGIFMIVYILLAQTKALIKKREGSIIILFGFIFMVFAYVNEILYYNQIMLLILPGSIAMSLWLLFLMVLISKRFSNAYKKVESFANDLKIEVENKTKDLRKEKEISEKEREKSDRLLLNVLPEQIAHRLKQGETPIADHFEEASVIFIDIADFTKLSARSKPQEIVKMLNDIFTIFDKISAKYGLEKIKTIGDCYMAAAGIPAADPDHAQKAAEFALEAMSALKDYDTGKGTILNFRCGIDCGPVVAGVIGENKFIYDVWGDMVNTASRMETNGIIGRIQCTERFKEKLSVVSSRLSDKGDSNELPTTDNRQLAPKFEERGEIEIKGKGKMRTWFLIDN